VSRAESSVPTRREAGAALITEPIVSTARRIGSASKARIVHRRGPLWPSSLEARGSGTVGHEVWAQILKANALKVGPHRSHPKQHLGLSRGRDPVSTGHA
jgi:hypothetical protein